MTALLEAMLLGAAVATGCLLLLYDVAAFRAHRSTEEQTSRTAGAAARAVDLRRAPAEHGLKSPVPDLDIVSRPMDTWIDDPVRRELEEL